MIDEKTPRHRHRPETPPPGDTFGGRGLRHPRQRDRAELEAFATPGAGQPLGALARFDSLFRDAEATRPDRLAALREEMSRLEDRFSAVAPDERVPVAEWVESICRPWILARAPLRGRGLEPSWAVDFLLRLLGDFDRSGQVIESVDPGWRRPVRAPHDVAATARLAVAAGWISWSHLIVDPGLAAPALTLLGELLDRLDALAHGPRAAAFGPDDRGWVLSAIALERRLLRHWRREGGTVH